MATEAQIIEGIKRADAAGDREGVKALGSALMAMRKTAKPRDNSALNAIALGAIKPIYNITEAAMQIPGVKAIDDFGVSIGFPSSSRVVDQNNAARQNNSRKLYQLAGNVAGLTAVTAATRGKGGAIGQGALGGALLTDSKDAVGIATDIALGGAGGYVGSKVLSSLGSLAAPVVSRSAKALRSAGVPMTMGQLSSAMKEGAGNLTSTAENIMGKLPFLKSSVEAARSNSSVGYYNAVLKRTGVNVPRSVEIGHETHDFIGRNLSNQYTALLPKLNISADQKLARGLSGVEARVRGIAPSSYNQFSSILKTAGLGGRSQSLTGAKMQHADKVLRVQAERFMRSPNPNDKTIGEGLDQVRMQLRSLAQRQNPEYAAQLSKLNKSWRELALIRKAAGDPNQTSGVFSPAAYARSARGSRSNQELTRAANRFLVNRSPDSGTTEGLGSMAMLMNPKALGGVAAGSLIYRPGVQRAMNSLVFAPRSKLVKGAGTVLKLSAKAAPQISAAAFANQGGQ